MVARLEKTESGYSIPLTAKMVEELRLEVGAAVEIQPVSDPTLLDATATQMVSVSRDEALASYERSKAKYGKAYEALAK